MIHGSVIARNAIQIPLPILDVTGYEQVIDAVLDTGFTGELTMPASLIASLQLPYLAPGRVQFADGRLEWIDIYRGVVVWDGVDRQVRVQSIEGDILIGMALLSGYELRARIIVGGDVQDRGDPVEHRGVGAARVPEETGMTIRAAIATIIACTGIGGGIGWGLGTFAPGYYRSVFPSGNQPWFDPVSVGVGQGLTQGTTGGVILGAIVVALLLCRDSCVHRNERIAAFPKADTSKAPFLDFQSQPRAVQHDPKSVQHIPPQQHP